MLFREFFSGIRAWFRAPGYLSTWNMNGLVILPAILSLLYAGLILGGGYFIREQMGERLIHLLPWNWYQETLTWLVRDFWWTFVLAFFAFTYRIGTFIFMSPVLSWLSDRVEQKLRGTQGPGFSLIQFFRDIIRAIRLNLRNLVWELGITVLLFFIPFVGWLGIFFVQSYFAGFNLMDYTLERHKMPLEDTYAYVWRHKGTALGIGIVFQLGILIPVLGWLLTSVYGTVAATEETLRGMDSDPELAKKQPA